MTTKVLLFLENLKKECNLSTVAFRQMTVIILLQPRLIHISMAYDKKGYTYD